jgi:RNA polymerase sigma-70 factor (ECF subfamily)
VEIAIDGMDDVLAAEERESVHSWEIERALNALTPGRRAVVAAISVDGRSIGETARSLGMTEAAVRVALHRGLKEILKRFGRT